MSTSHTEKAQTTGLTAQMGEEAGLGSNALTGNLSVLMKVGSASRSTGIVTTVEAALAPLLLSEGYELVLLTLGGTPPVLRLLVDKKDADKEGLVGLDDCAYVSRLVGDFLDGEGLSDAIPGAYHLEVSSPGLDRPLVYPKDFQRFVGREIKVVLEHGSASNDVSGNSRRRFECVIEEADLLEVTLGLDDGSKWVVAYGDLAKVRLIPNFDL